MKLAYDGVGNITTWDYRNAQTNYGPPYDLTQKPTYQYGFTYDNLNRLTSGTLNQQGQAKFTLGNLSYDNNGNIQTLNRALGAATDQLTYIYKSNSNQLMSVSDGGSADFAKSSSYAYDGNGNLTQDGAKSVTSIAYNHLNLPSQISRSSGGNVNYGYLASGQKLWAQFPAVGNTPAKRYDYVGGLVYENNQLEFIPTAEGRVLPPGRASTTVTTGSSTSVIASNQFYRYEYHLKDHLGNLRVACRCGERQTETTPGESYEPLVVQEQHYDPFGLDLTGLNSQMGLIASRLKYLDRELQPDLGLYDLQARFYDPSIGRFTTVDPVTQNQEEYSTYQYSYNNPITKSDPDGKWPGEGIFKSIRNWLSAPLTTDQKQVSRSLNESFTGKNYESQTRGEVLASAIGQGLKHYGGTMPGSMKFGPLPRGTTSTVAEAPLAASNTTKAARGISVATSKSGGHTMVGVEAKNGSTVWFHQTSSQTKGVGSLQVGAGNFSVVTDGPNSNYRVSSTQVSSANADAAMGKAYDMLGDNTYNSVTNSCVTCAKQVLNAGGVNPGPLILTPKGLENYMKDKN